MDEVKIGSKLMRNLIAKLVKRAIRKNVGYDVDIQLNDLNATIIDGTAHIHVCVDAEINKDEFTKILGSIGI